MTDQKNFDKVADKFLCVDKDVLQDLTSRIANGEFVKANNEAEQLCFSLLGDLQYASKKTKGSISSKKIMQSELWSLATHIGAPTWYITMSPCDHKHPLCIYFADTNEKFDVPLRNAQLRRELLGQNPVAGARFFDYIVKLFLKHIVGDDTVNSGLFGPVSGYYCTVEQ
ncbi:hypothetical protein F5877DRAFT_45423, partial [Lentinula edodes]